MLFNIRVDFSLMFKAGKLRDKIYLSVLQRETGEEGGAEQVPGGDLILIAPIIELGVCV